MQPQTPELEAFIRRVPVFRDLPPPMFDLVRKSCQVRRYNENEYLFQQGEVTKGMYIVVSGEAALMQVGKDGLKRQIGMVRPGQFIDQQAVFNEGIETSSLKAVLPVTAVFLSRRDMSALMAYYKELPALMGLAAQSQALHEVRFKTQRENEQILLRTHRHAWAYMRWALLPLLGMVGLWLLATTFSVPSLSCVVFIMSILIAGGTLTYMYIEWANDAIIITDQRVIRINKDVFPPRESINEVLVDSIQEARADIPGTDPFAVLFNYGIIDIRTGGQAGNFHLDFIPNPEAVQKLIMYDHHIRRQVLQEAERSEMRSDLMNWMNGQPVVVAGAKKPPVMARARGILGSVETRPDGSIIYRKHWIVWLRGAFPALLVLGLAILMAIATLFTPFLQNIGAAAWTITFLMALIGGLWLLYADWDWRHDYMHLQDTTITILHQRPLWMQNQRDQVLLKQVDNVIAETVGFTARILGYGTIRLSLVGADQHKVFPYTPQPQAVQGEITRRQAALRKTEEAAREQQEKERIGEYFQLYHEMQGSQNPDMGRPSSRPPSMKTDEVPAVRPSMPIDPAPSTSYEGWQTANNVIPTPPPPGSTPVPNANYDYPAGPTMPPKGRVPSGWTPTNSSPPPIPPTNNPTAPRPPLVATGGQPDRNRPPRIPLDRPSLSQGKPYTAPRVDQPPPPPPDLPQPPPPPPSRPFPRPQR
jgi:hypothetical protein